ncbi:MAG: YecA family protein [Enterobacteriaceae bacterium]|jgi:yecA family protein|nr:YecA family protein [Enterobacteriaceae bacterium]
MTTENTLPTFPSLSYPSLNNALTQQNIGLTASEMHGLISGLICGGSNDSSWTVMVHDLTNEGLAFGYPLGDMVKQIYQQTKEELEDDGFGFDLLLPDDETAVFERIDALAGWVNHFLLGLGMMQPKLGQIKGDVGEAIDDLRNIAQLGYDEDEDQEELAHALEEVMEYVRMAAMLCHSEFARLNTTVPENVKPTLH